MLSPWVRQDQQTSTGVAVPHSTNDDVLPGTGVKRSTATGNIPFEGAFRISDFVSSGSSLSLSESGPDPVLKPIITTQILSPEPKVSPPQSNSRSFHTSLDYFVTEPPDSPKALQTNLLNIPSQNSLTHIPQTIITPSQNNPNFITKPDKPIQSEILDITLASVFKSLNLKRKAQEDPSESNSSKILRLCSPAPMSTRKAPTRNRIVTRTNRSIKTSSKGNDSLSGNAMLEEGLVEIPVLQLPNSSGATTPLVPGTPMEVALEIQRLNGQRLLAGLKQPQSQC
ncbi:hypothetical protein RHMOL_Rhmol01G0141400 [Rhododendron molle]|uniref:Uncharacterized protein n=1 Tax=Rhododendron molle TaxID=49168 RepID=A0ACC0Q1X4_RHOML|nr:hypothetical protein RHMOL_Rhmol01G0141400 [Rhododendron molle]